MAFSAYREAHVSWWSAGIAMSPADGLMTVMLVPFGQRMVPGHDLGAHALLFFLLPAQHQSSTEAAQKPIARPCLHRKQCRNRASKVECWLKSAVDCVLCRLWLGGPRSLSAAVKDTSFVSLVSISSLCNPWVHRRRPHNGGTCSTTIAHSLPSHHRLPAPLAPTCPPSR